MTKIASEPASSQHRDVLIVGGGAAGWMTAAYLAKHLGTDRNGGPKITVMESPDIGIIGVGEGTFPTIRNILRTLGIDEADFMRESHATFKQGIRFDDWEVTPKDGRHSHYFHPFEQPYWSKEELNLLPYWLLQDKDKRLPFAEAVTFQKKVADSKLAPKRIHQGNYQGPLNYAYHFDAHRFAGVLAKYAKDLGVHHLSGNLDGVTLDADGAIAHITAKEHGDLKADLYIDCTGFRSEILGKAMGVPFKSIKDTLFTDRAVAIQVPYEKPDAPLESYTISTAHEAGWTWDIALSTRRGIGYVYSSDHTDDDRAEEVLRAYVGPMAEGIEARCISFNAGYRTQHWVKNCIGVGLSAGFLEPLESTGMVLIESAVNKIVEFFPFRGPLDASAHIFNEAMTKRYETIIGFIKLHYCLTKREEPFWRDNTRPDSIPPHLRDLLALWKFRPPSRFDFTLDNESFAFFSYQYILYGMNFETDYEAARGSLQHTDLANHLFARIVQFGDQASKDLVSHRQLINAVYKGGFVERPNTPMAVAR
ncbi:tryptophan halogenase family protein [Asticcacaulis sp. 201]|uniref:tryptophan halogenase family protein n=1 Tax=Asticcacaulis sp. 201 TaxID=3028787 RepID=UPI002916B281|nr:tryptophan halogenase family protein [Asticcacaulis sp. 201]MDV6331613.1 tryptophan halogenase family protein [Asticcacaulis sp. 201]